MNTKPGAMGDCQLLWALLALTAAISVGAAAPAAPPVKIRLSVDEDPIVLRLATSLGYFRSEGVEIVPVKVEEFEKEDYLLQAPLDRGQIDAAYHWFAHTVFGARHGIPVTAVMLFNDAPAMTVMVADRVKDQIKSAADFRGRRIAQGAGYATKAMVTTQLTVRSGLPPHSYTPILMETQGRQEAVLRALQAGTVDVMTFQEPITSALLATGKASVLYDLTSGETTARVLGAPLPAQSLLMSPKYLKAHPTTVQHLVNALVRSMKFINTHSTAQIAAALPPDYFAGKNRTAEVSLIAKSLPSFTHGSFGFTPAGVQLIVDSIRDYDFDDSEEGQWRATASHRDFDVRSLYTNRFVDHATENSR